MKVLNAIRKFEKNGFTMQMTPSGLFAKKEGFRRYIKILRNGGDFADDVAVLELCTAGTEDPENSGIFCDNVTQAIRLVNC